MNRVLITDFGLESCYNFTPDPFSDVFRPASCMQSCQLSEHKKRKFSLHANLKTLFRAVPQRRI